MYFFFSTPSVISNKTLSAFSKVRLVVCQNTTQFSGPGRTWNIATFLAHIVETRNTLNSLNLNDESLENCTDFLSHSLQV